MFFKEHFDINTRTAALQALPVYPREDDSVFFKTWNVGFYTSHLSFKVIYLLVLMKQVFQMNLAVALVSMVNGDLRVIVHFDHARIAILL